MTVLIFTKGLPGSGKSTWAREMADKEPGKWKLVDKDSLRKLLDNGRWSKKNETFVLKVRDLIISNALEDGYSVIAHDTNFEESHANRFKELAAKHGVKLRSVSFDEDVEVCIKRDLARADSVGESVIRSMYDKYLRPEPAPAPQRIAGEPDAILVDLDGTLALLNGRNPYDASTCEQDLLNEAVYDVLTSWHTTHQGHGKIILMSGRQSEFRPETERWLAANDVFYEHLYMRATGDLRKDSIIKRELYETHVKGQYNISFVLDDRQQVVDGWRSMGLVCLQVAPGKF